MIAVAVMAVWRPAGRPMEDWAFVLLRYWAVPRVAIWRPRKVVAYVEEEKTTYEVVVEEPRTGRPDETEEANFDRLAGYVAIVCSRRPVKG